MRPDTRQMLATISESFTVSDIMVPVAQLIRASKRSEADQHLSEFDVIPAPGSGPITDYFHRGALRRRRIAPPELVSERPPLLELPGLLFQRQFFFVLQANELVGYVHYSDLNNAIVKLPIFVLLESLEGSLWELVNQWTTRDDLEQCFQDSTVAKILEQRRASQIENIDIDWTGSLYFIQLLRLGEHHGAFALGGRRRGRLNDLRNRVAHAGNLLVESYKDVGRLVEGLDLLESLDNQVQRALEEQQH